MPPPFMPAFMPSMVPPCSPADWLIEVPVILPTLGIFFVIFMGGLIVGAWAGFAARDYKK